MRAPKFLIGQIVHEAIQYFSYKKRKAQFLYQSIKIKSKDRVTKLLNKFKHLLKLNMLWFLPNDKSSRQDKMGNTQKNCWLAMSPNHELRVIEINHPVNVLGVIASVDDVMPTPIFQHGLKLNTDAYIICPEEIVLLQNKRVAAGRPYVWHQDSAPCHTIKKTQSWLRDNSCYHMSRNIWLRDSPNSLTIICRAQLSERPRNS